MTNETKSPQSDKPEPQGIIPQDSELDAAKLDEVTGGGNSGSTIIPHVPPVSGPSG